MSEAEGVVRACAEAAQVAAQYECTIDVEFGPRWGRGALHIVITPTVARLTAEAGGADTLVMPGRALPPHQPDAHETRS